MLKTPYSRFVVRTLVSGVVAYLALVFGSGQEAFELDAFLWGLGAALVAAVAGLLGPHEPFVGVQNQDAQVPVPPADPVRP